MLTVLHSTFRWHTLLIIHNKAPRYSGQCLEVLWLLFQIMQTWIPVTSNKSTVPRATAVRQSLNINQDSLKCPVTTLCRVQLVSRKFLKRALFKICPRSHSNVHKLVLLHADKQLCRKSWAFWDIIEWTSTVDLLRDTFDGRGHNTVVNGVSSIAGALWALFLPKWKSESK